MAATPSDGRPLWVVLHGSAELYGSDRVLLATISALRADPLFCPIVLLHEDGPLREELRSAGVEVHVGEVTKIRRAMFSPRGLLNLPIQLATTAQVLDQVVNGRSVALVYSNTLAVLGGAIWAWRRGLPHLWHVHEILQRPTLVRKGLPWLAAKLSHCVLANSQQTRLWLEHEVPALHGRVTVASNGLAHLPRPPAEAISAFRTSLGVAGGDVVATLVGRFNHMKGQPLLVRALAKLRDARRAEHLKLVLVGDVFAGHQDFRANCDALIRAMSLQDRVTILPFVHDIAPVWYGSDIAVVPSTEPESFGMVAIEAMAAGLPVIAAAHGGLLDVVQDGVTGMLFPPNDVEALAEALGRLADDPAMRGRLGLEGQHRQARCFSLASQVQQTREAGLAVMVR